MPSENRPASDDKAPDAASSYERAKPREEAGQGRMDNNQATPTKRPDKLEEAVTNRQKPRQLNADDVIDQRATEPPRSADDSKK